MRYPFSTRRRTRAEEVHRPPPILVPARLCSKTEQNPVRNAHYLGLDLCSGAVACVLVFYRFVMVLSSSARVADAIRGSNMATITALKNPATVAPLDSYNPGQYYCELIGSKDAGTVTSPHCGSAFSSSSLAASRTGGGCGARAFHARHHLHGLQRPLRHRPHPAFRCHPAGYHRLRLAQARPRHQAADQGAQSVSLGRLSRAQNPERRASFRRTLC